MWKQIFGVALVIGVFCIGVHSCDDAQNIAKQNTAVVVPHASLPKLTLLDLPDFKPCPTMVDFAKTKKPIKHFAKTKKHHHKFLVLHHHKYHPHKHKTHHHGHHHGHHHHAPNKISTHGPPTHLTGPPPGCR